MPAARPELWPETTEGLGRAFGRMDACDAATDRGGAGSQAQKMAMLRRYGWGVPQLPVARCSSATNDATLMVEEKLLPLRLRMVPRSRPAT